MAQEYFIDDRGVICVWQANNHRLDRFALMGDIEVCSTTFSKLPMSFNYVFTVRI